MLNHLKILKYTIGMVLVLVLLGTVPSFFTFNDKKASIEQELNSIVDYVFNINGDVKISLLPVPKITMENVTAKAEGGDTIQVNKVVIFPSLLSIISDDISINKIAIHDADLNLSKIRMATGKGGGSGGELNIPNFDLVNTSVTFDSEVGNEVEFRNINASFNFSGTISKDLTLSSNFILGTNSYALNAQFNGIGSDGNTDDAAFELTSGWTKLNFEGELKTLFDSPKLDGKMNLSILEADDDEAFNVITNLAALDEFSASADILITDSVISINNFEIKSNSITNAKGELEWLFGFEQELDVKLVIDQINIDSLVSEEEQAFEELSAIIVMESLIRPLINEFSIEVQNQIFGGVSFKVKEIIYNEQTVENLDLNFDLYNGDMVLNHLKFQAPGETSYYLSGSMSFNDIRPRFDGNSELQVKDLIKFADWLKISLSEKLISEKPKLQLSTQLVLIPRSLRLLGMRFQIGKNLIRGKASFKDTGSSRLSTKLSLRVNEINTNDFNLDTSIDDLITNMYINDSDKYGYQFVEYVDDYKWLRKFPIDLTAELLVDKAVYKDRYITKVHTAFRVSPNSLHFDRVSINSNLIKMYGSLGMDLTALKPNVYVDLDIKQLNSAELFRLLPKSDALYQQFVEKNIKDREELSKLKGEDVEKFNIDYKNQPKPFNFLSIHNFNAEYKVNAENIFNAELPIEGFFIKGKIYEGVIDFDQLQIDVFNGRMDAKGSIVILSTIPNLNFSYAINNFNPNSALKYLFGVDNLDGYMSANGNIIGAGHNMPTLLYNLAGAVNFIGKKVTFTGMDLGEIIRVSELNEALNVRIEKLKYFGNNGETVFDDVNGRMTIKKGIASLTNVNLSTNRSRGIYAAEVDYMNHLINSKGKISFIPIGTASSLNIEMDSKGKMNAQNVFVNLDNIVKYLQLRLGSSEAAKQQEEKARSLLRNRRL